jgi:hypothetical protein
MDNADEDIARITQGAAHIIAELVQDPTYGAAAADEWSALAAKWHVVAALWAAMRDAVPAAHLRECAPGLQAALLAHSGGLDEDADALAAWARVCAQTHVLGDREDLAAFFDGVRTGFGLDARGQLAVWAQFADMWARDPEASMDEAVFLLGILYAWVAPSLSSCAGS